MMCTMLPMKTALQKMIESGDALETLDGVDEPGLVLSGAIIVFQSKCRTALSFLPGCLWPGANTFPEGFGLETFKGTKIKPRRELTQAEVWKASAANSFWFAAFREPAPHRLLVALDALGACLETQRFLAFVTGIARESVIKELPALVHQGLIQREVFNNKCTTTLYEHVRGRFWPFGTGERTLLNRLENMRQAVPPIELKRQGRDRSQPLRPRARKKLHPLASGG